MHFAPVLFFFSLVQAAALALLLLRLWPGRRRLPPVVPLGGTVGSLVVPEVGTLFVVLLVVLKKFAWGPIVAGLAKREQGRAN